MTWTPENVAKLAREGREKFATKEPQMTDQELAREICPCQCNTHKDGSHWHDCPVQYQDDIAAAIEAARTEEREAIIKMIQYKIDALADPSWENLNDIVLAIRSRNEQ